MSHQNHPSKHIQNLFPTTPKFLPCVFFFFSLTLFEKRTRREIPPRKKVSKNCCCFLGRRRRQKTEDSNIIERKKHRRKISIFLRFWSHLRAYSKHHVHVHTRHDRVCFNVLGYQSAPTPTRHQQEIELGRSIIIRAR